MEKFKNIKKNPNRSYTRTFIDSKIIEIENTTQELEEIASTEDIFLNSLNRKSKISNLSKNFWQNLK